MSDTANTANNTQETGTAAVANAVTTPPTVDASPQPAEAVAGASPSTDKKKTPVSGTKTGRQAINNMKRPRRSFIERAQEESEELVRTMGGSLELEGGRRTRSSTRGTPRAAPVVTPPPTKKGRSSPLSTLTTPQKAGRSRARKNIAAAIDEPEPSEQKDDEVPSNVEKNVEEPTKAEPKAAAKSNNETASVKESNVNTDSSSEKDTVQNEDKTDAVGGDLKPIQEGQQNNIDHIVADSSENDETESEQTETKTTKEVSAKLQITPMEVDQDQEEVKASEVEKKSETITTKTEENSPPAAPVIVVTPAAPEAAEEATKEPTPEAMEVDSVSKSNNATVEPKLVDSNKPTNEVAETTTTAVPTPTTVNETKEISSITESATVDSAPIVVANNDTKLESNKDEPIPPPTPPSTQNIISVEKNTPLAEIASKNVELNLSNSTATPIVDASAAGEPEANTISPIKKPNAIEQPSEPTIKSTSESSDNTTNVSTPQVCN